MGGFGGGRGGQQSQTVTVEKTTVIERQLREDADKYKQEIANLKTTNEKLKSQLAQLQKLLSSQSKQISELKTSNATLIQQSTMTTTTTTISSSESSQTALLQANYEKLLGDYKRGEATISTQQITISELTTKVNYFESRARELETGSTQRIRSLEDELARTKEELRVSKSDDESDHRKHEENAREIVSLRAQLAETQRREADLAQSSSKWKLEYEQHVTTTTTIQRDYESIKMKLSNLNMTLNEKMEELKRAESTKRDNEEEIGRLTTQVKQRDSRLKELESRIASYNEKVKVLTESSEKYLERAREAEEKQAKTEMKLKEAENKMGEMTKGFDILKVQLANATGMSGKMTTRITELETIIRRKEEKLNEFENERKKGEQQVNQLNHLLMEKSKEIEGWKSEDASDNAKIESLGKTLGEYSMVIKAWEEENKRDDAMIASQAAELKKRDEKIAKCKTLIHNLKQELDAAHSLSLKFEIKRQEKVEERTVEREQLVTEVKKATMALEDYKRNVASSESACREIRTQNEKIATELGVLRMEMEKLKALNQTLQTDLNEEKRQKQSLIQDKQTVSIEKTKEVEKERSYFKSAEEHVATYRTDINKKYNQISTLFSQVEQELV